MKNYPSKILLFGEHIVNRGAQALATPYPAFGGSWQHSDNRSQQQSLQALFEYLKNLKQKDELLCQLDLDAFQQALNEGLYFASDIPVGYGLGSSGALCAAIYDRFCLEKISPNEAERFGELRSALAQMESFFHGTSSGTDPLICHLNQPVLIQPDGKIETATLPPASPLTFFLLDTQIPRRTSPLVQYFLKRCADQAFANRVEQELVETTNNAVANFLNANWEALFDNIHAISRFQIEALPTMTPDHFHAVWTQGLQGNLYRLKLCGAGGGGFILGCTVNWEETQSVLEEYILKVAYPV